MTDTNKRECPYCGAQVRGHPNKRFCSPAHRYAYHNSVNPRGYQQDKGVWHDPYDGVDPEGPGWGAHEMWGRE